MGQKLSSQPNTPLVWILRGQPKLHPKPEQPIKFQYKTRRKSAIVNAKSPITAHHEQPPSTTDLTSGLQSDAEAQNNPKIKRTTSTALIDDVDKRNKSLHCNRKSVTNLKLRNTINECNSDRSDLSQNNLSVDKLDKFGYEIEDIDQFLEKASIEKPANIPVVLSVPSVLYQTRVGGYQAEVALPLGMVVNAVFRNQHWLYAQTPHGEEGYIAYTACIPLGIIPASIGDDEDDSQPCWESSADVFPRPSGNVTDSEKLSECSTQRRRRCPRKRRHRHTTGAGRAAAGGAWLESRLGAASACGERSVDRLYMRASSGTCSEIGVGRRQALVQRHTLLVIGEDYDGAGEHNITVRRGDVVTLLSAHLKGWFWVRASEGEEGFIPAVIAGYGYL